LYLGDASSIGKHVGGAVLLANLGSILGSIGAATVLLPWLGSMDSTRLLVGINVLLALTVVCFAPGSRPERLRWAGPVIITAVVFAALIPASLPNIRNALGRIPSRVIFEEEGELATVRVSEALKNPAIRGMSIDATTIGVSAGWRFSTYRKQLLLAHLPMWLEPRIRNVLQIGLGSASTLDTLTQYPTLEKIESVEINAAVVRGAEFFEESRAFADPRVTVHVEDAIHYLLSHDTRYDLIIADGKQGSDCSGNAKMLSQELYQIAHDRLTEHGIFAQWISTQTLPEDYEVIVRTAASVFPYLNVFYDLSTTTIIVGSRQPLDGRLHMATEDFPPAVSESLARIQLERLDLLRFGWMADRDALLEAIGPGPINRWSNSVIEFAAYRATLADIPSSKDATNILLLLDARKLALDRAPAGFVAANPNRREAHRLIRVAFVELNLGRRQKAIAVLARARELAPEDPLVIRAQARLSPKR